MRQVHRLLRHDHGRQQRTIHEREVGVGEAGVVPGDPRAEEHLGEDRQRGDGDEPREARARVERWHRPAIGALRDEDRGGEHGERHPEVRGDELGGEALEHHRGPEQRLHDDEDAGYHRGGEQRPIAPPAAEHGDQADGPDQRTDEDGGHQPVRMLDPGVEVPGRDPVAEAEGPVRAAESRIGGADEPAHGDQDEGGHGSSHRQLGESGHIGSSAARGRESGGERAWP
jgi:hypothetical protein